MDKIKNILALTDLSEFSQEGVGYALKLARTLGAEVTVYHVVNCNHAELHSSGAENGTTDVASPQYGRVRRNYQLALARFLNDHFADLIPWVKIREKVEIGVPDKAIIEWAKREGTDLVVISTHAKSDLSGGFAGTLAAKIVVNVPCPVLCLHGAEEGRSREPLAEAG
ncbi:MAG TPA: universal stress protein [Candidatus Binatia bacterium]|jgi:nucleotide-binding universal stress UspA family protein